MNDLLLGLLLGYTAGTVGTLITFFLASLAGETREESASAIPLGSDEVPVA